MFRSKTLSCREELKPDPPTHPPIGLTPMLGWGDQPKHQPSIHPPTDQPKGKHDILPPLVPALWDPVSPNQGRGVGVTLCRLLSPLIH